jgi:uncharacterized protein (DUF1800 family)
MRRLLMLLLILPLNAFAAGMGYADARQLLSRTGFAPTETEIETFATLTRAEAVGRLLADVRTEPQASPPPEVTELIPPERLRRLKNASEEEKKAFRREQFQKSLELRAWWYREMLDTPSPLTERMTLFWHNHFACSQQKVRSPALMYRQNLLLRRDALGNFGELLHAVARDPAMVIYLDSVSNKKGEPNENFAREVMELFTLGEGHFSEQDVREAARAFTGWSLDRRTGEFRFRARMHDYGEKTVLGRSGDFDGDDVLDILLAQPATAKFIAAKLWREFVSPTPDPREVSRLATVFRNSHYEIKPLLRALLTSDAFYATQNRAVLIKSPVELIVGTLRLLDIHPDDLRPVAFAGRNLGEDIFAPPNVKGWPGGETWINSQTLLARRQLITRLFRAEETPMPAMLAVADRDPVRAMRQRAVRMQQDYRFDASRWFAQFPHPQGLRQASLTRLVLARAPQAEPPADANDRAYLRALLLDPVYQLK